MSGYERRAFDQGLGRSFWLVNGGGPALVAQTIASCSAARQADLWSGIGLAATYAGIADESVLAELRTAAGQNVPHLAQGSAFAAKARQRAGNLTDYTSVATEMFCNLPAEEAARLCDTAQENLPTHANPPASEIWRQRVQAHFVKSHQLQAA